MNFANKFKILGGAVPCKTTSTHNLTHVTVHKDEKATPDELEPLEMMGAEKNLPKIDDDEEADDEKMTPDSSLKGISVDVSTVHHNSETEEEKSPPNS